MSFVFCVTKRDTSSVTAESAEVDEVPADTDWCHAGGTLSQVVREMPPILVPLSPAVRRSRYVILTYVIAPAHCSFGQCCARSVLGPPTSATSRRFHFSFDSRVVGRVCWGRCADPAASATGDAAAGAESGSTTPGTNAWCDCCRTQRSTTGCAAKRQRVVVGRIPAHCAPVAHR